MIHDVFQISASPDLQPGPGDRVPRVSALAPGTMLRNSLTEVPARHQNSCRVVQGVKIKQSEMSETVDDQRTWPTQLMCWSDVVAPAPRSALERERCKLREKQASGEVQVR